jgi:hypothetical protein
MSASKKTTSKTAKSPAPATKPSSTKAPAKKKVSAPAPASARAAKLAPPLAPAPVELPVVKSIASTPILTTIAARIDVGFGNALFIRGEGPGLSWDRGLAMECVADDLWRIALAETGRAFTFKFLVNDLTWSVGPDFSVAAGTSVTLTPEF